MGPPQCLPPRTVHPASVTAARRASHHNGHPWPSHLVASGSHEFEHQQCESSRRAASSSATVQQKPNPLMVGRPATRDDRKHVRHDGDVPDTAVTITLTSDEALILFDLLHRWEDDKLVSPPQHGAEQVALWNLSSLLERELADPFDARYGDLVLDARTRLAPGK
jgi:hypothetical protein